MSAVLRQSRLQECVVVVGRGVSALLMLVGAAQSECEVQTLIDFIGTVGEDLGGVCGVVVFSLFSLVGQLLGRETFEQGCHLCAFVAQGSR